MLKTNTLCQILTVSCLALGLSACVKQNTYNNTGKPAPVSKVDNTEAAKTRIALGLQYLKVGQMSNAKFNLEKAKVFAPNLSSVHTAFAYYYQKVSEDALAEQAYEKAIELDPFDADALNNYGTFLCRMKRYDEAEQTLLKAIKVPSYLQVAQSYENAALCAMENQQYDKAKKYFIQSLDHSALRANTLVNIAGLSYAMGEYKAAQMYAQRLENIGVVTPRVLLLRSLIELKLGQVTQSKKYGTTLVSMYVKTPEALMYLSKSFENSEFEQLRRLYLKHQYQAFVAAKRDSDNDKRSATQNSQPKVKRKLSPGKNQSEPVVTTISPSIENKPNEDVSQNELGQSLVQALPRVVKQQPESIAAVSISPEPAKALHVPFHVVELGETLFDLSFKYNIKMRSLQQWNNIDKNGKLLVGQKVYLNNPRIYHTIGDGDTLYGISLKYKIRLDRLLQWNDMQQNAPLATGQKILIVNPEQYSL